jgi:hypothetical protein
MENPFPSQWNHTGKPRSLLCLLLAIVAINFSVAACSDDGILIERPDEFTHVFRASERHILRAIAQTFRDRDLGKPTINEEAQEILSDYIDQGEWRVRGLARIRDLGGNEREVTLSILTEKRTPTGWELRRLLGKEQYQKFFDAIDTQIYREMSKPD